MAKPCQSNDSSREKLSGLIIIALLFLGFITAFSALKKAVKTVDIKNIEEVTNGKQAALFEDKFNDNYMLFDTAKNIWGDIEYIAFKDGRDGVLIGQDGWLFSTEEFSVPQKREELINEHVSFIYETADTLTQQDIKLLIALVPAKARIHEDRLGRHRYPAINKALYHDVRETLMAKGIIVPDLHKALSALENAFMRTDTHWSPAGAQVAAKAIARSVENLTIEQKEFTLGYADNSLIHNGDLTRYVPGFAFAMKTEDLYTPVTKSAQEESLFGDANIPVTLVGTSYSADQKWHFEGFLKHSLQADVLNVADAGQGPFETMRTWLDSAAYKGAKPALVIWEIPERYMTMPDITRE